MLVTFLHLFLDQVPRGFLPLLCSGLRILVSSCCIRVDSKRNVLSLQKRKRHGSKHRVGLAVQVNMFFFST